MRYVITFVDVAAVVSGSIFYGFPMKGPLCSQNLEWCGREDQAALGQPSKVQEEWPLLFLVLAPFDFVSSLEKEKKNLIPCCLQFCCISLFLLLS